MLNPNSIRTLVMGNLKSVYESILVLKPAGILVAWFISAKQKLADSALRTCATQSKE